MLIQSKFNLFFYDEGYGYINMIVHLPKLDYFSNFLLSIVFNLELYGLVFCFNIFLAPQSKDHILSVSNSLFYIFLRCRVNLTVKGVHFPLNMLLELFMFFTALIFTSAGQCKFINNMLRPYSLLFDSVL